MYCAGGSLWDAIRRVSSKGSWSWHSRLQVLQPTLALASHPPPPTPHPLLQILADVAQALLHMHELDPPLIHRDVKSPNILLTASLPDARARLADLGCTKVSLACFGLRWLCAECSAGVLARGADDVRGNATVDGA